MAQEKERDNMFYPDGDELIGFIAKRNRQANIWRNVFLAALGVAILALLALIYNFTSEAFGFAAFENENDPSDLIFEYERERILNKANAISSESDEELVAGVAQYGSAIGYFGYAFYQENADALKLVSVNGVMPTAETAADGTYPLSRPLFIYTSPEVIAENPSVGAFVDYYLQNVNGVIDDVGYFPISEGILNEELEMISGLIGGFSSDTSNTVSIAGSSTVFPLTSRIAEGFGGDVSVDSIGSSAGIRAFCNDTSIDIANASRPMRETEIAACQANGREPIEIMVGTDALAIVVNPGNSQINDITLDELGLAFTTNNFWDEVNPAFGADGIVTLTPGGDSGTLDFFLETVYADTTFETMSNDDLVNILAANISTGRGRALEQEQRFFADRLVFNDEARFVDLCSGEDVPGACVLEARDQANILEVLLIDVVNPEVVQTWPFFRSIFQRNAILAEAGREFPDADLVFKSWLNWDFLSSQQSSRAELAGIQSAIIGSILVVLITLLFSFPVGVGTAIYMEEYASKENWFNRLIQTNINNLAGVPSIIYGLLGLAVFVRILLPLTSGQIFGLAQGDDPSGRTILSAGLTLGLLILPMIIINSQEAIRAVPNSIRRAGLGLGATQWQTIWSHVLPQAIPGILTGTILAMSRAIGETAPIIVVGASTLVLQNPNSIFSRFTTLPIQIYQWTSRPQPEFQNIAAAAIIVLLIILLTLNSVAIYLRNRYATR